MSEGERSPGPWRAGDGGKIWGADGIRVCTLYRKLPANARLIAAAPELVEALEALVAGVGELACASSRQCNTTAADVAAERAEALLARVKGAG